MDWSGHKVNQVRVIDGKYEYYEFIGKVNKYGYQGRLRGDRRSLWTQPVVDGRPLPVYYGFVPIVFRGQVVWDRLTALPATRDFVQKLLDSGVHLTAIHIVMAAGDFYIFVEPEAFGLKPGTMFIRECESVARRHANGLPYDADIYIPEATMPLYGSKINDKQYVVDFGVRDFFNFSAFGDWYYLTLSYIRRPPHVTKSKKIVFNHNYDPLKNPVNLSIRDQLPNGLQKLLTIALPEEKLEELCFAVGLAYKDAGATPEDAMALLDTAVDINRMDKSLRRATVNRAFRLKYRFGWRTFVKKFPEVELKADEEKSSYIHFERQWLEKLIEANAPYTAHKLLFELLIEYHGYPRPILPIPGWTSQKLLRQALRGLEEASIIKRLNKREVTLCFDHIERSQNYVRVPVKYLEQVTKLDQAVRLFTVVMKSSQHYKDHHGLWTTLKVETICDRLQRSERTIYYFLEDLRTVGIPIVYEDGVMQILFDDKANSDVLESNPTLNQESDMFA